MLSGPMQKFCEAIVAGKNGLEAYLAAHPAAARSTAVSAAPRLLKRPEVKAEILRLRALEQQKTTMTLIEKRKFLARIVRASIASLPEDSDLWQSITHSKIATIYRLPDKIAAIAADNALSGDADGARVNDYFTSLLASLRN